MPGSSLSCLDPSAQTVCIFVLTSLFRFDFEIKLLQNKAPFQEPSAFPRHLFEPWKRKMICLCCKLGPLESASLFMNSPNGTYLLLFWHAGSLSSRLIIVALCHFLNFLQVGPHNPINSTTYSTKLLSILSSSRVHELAAMGFSHTRVWRDRTRFLRAAQSAKRKAHLEDDSPSQLFFSMAHFRRFLERSMPFFVTDLNAIR